MPQCPPHPAPPAFVGERSLRTARRPAQTALAPPRHDRDCPRCASGVKRHRAAGHSHRVADQQPHRCARRGLHGHRQPCRRAVDEPVGWPVAGRRVAGDQFPGLLCPLGMYQGFYRRDDPARPRRPIGPLDCFDDEATTQFAVARVLADQPLAGLYDAGSGTPGIHTALSQTGEKPVWIGHEASALHATLLRAGAMSLVLDRTRKARCRPASITCCTNRR